MGTTKSKHSEECCHTIRNELNLSDLPEINNDTIQSLRAYQSMMDREDKYNQALSELQNNNIKTYIQLLTEVANDAHPTACVLLWMFYTNVNNTPELIELYKTKSQKYVIYIDEKIASTLQENQPISSDLFIASQWCSQNGIGTQQLITPSENILNDPLHNLLLQHCTHQTI